MKAKKRRIKLSDGSRAKMYGAYGYDEVRIYKGNSYRGRSFVHERQMLRDMYRTKLIIKQGVWWRDICEYLGDPDEGKSHTV